LPCGGNASKDYEAVGFVRMLFCVGLRMTLDSGERSSTGIAVVPVEAGGGDRSRKRR
jgi:hypothetical protein